MHILFTSDFLDPENMGGGGRVILELARRVVRDGHQATIFAGGHAAGETVIHAGEHDIPLTAFPYPTRGNRGMRTLVKVRKEIRRIAQDLPDTIDVAVHSQPNCADVLGNQVPASVYLFHSPWAMEYLVEKLGGDRPEDIKKHGLISRLGFEARKRMEARCIRRANQVVTLSAYMCQQVISLHGTEPDDVTVLPGGVDYDRFPGMDDDQRRHARDSWGCRDGEKLLVCVRRLVSRTGVDLLIQALGSFGKEHPEIRLLIAGRGPEQAKLQGLATRHGVSDRVEFLGYVDDSRLPGLYAAGDLTIVPTRSLEGFGLSTLESLASGTPVFATPVGGSMEILEGLHPRLLAADVSAQAIADGLRFWLESPDELATTRARARSYARENYNWDRMSGGLLRVVESCLVT